MSDADRLARLPKWAADRIEVLQRDLAAAHELLGAGPENSDTFADPYGDAARPLGTGERIQFGRDRRTAIEARLENGVLYLHATGGALEVQPTSSNGAKVRVGEWWR